MKKFILFLLLCLSGIQCNRLFAYETTMLGRDFNNYNFFEYVKECFDKNKLGQIIKENQNNECRFDVIYDLEGTLKSFYLDSPFERIPDYQYFTEGEWEALFDYFYRLPRLPMPNPPQKMYFDTNNYLPDLGSVLSFVYESQTLQVSYDAVRVSWKINKSDSISNITKNEINLNDPQYIKRYGGIGSVYGDMNLVDMKRAYYQAVNDGKFKQKQRIKYWEPIFNANLNIKGYYWDKILLNNYSVKMQLPIGAKIVNSPDSLSASINLPYSCRLSIQYSKGDDGLKLFKGENNQRNRRILRLLVRDRYMLLWGKFEQSGKTTYWQRIRYRYGVTITLYATNMRILEQYFEDIISSTTIVLRPKYKNIYLKD